MKRPVAHAVKNRKTLDMEQDFFKKQIQRKSGNFMFEFHNDESSERILAPKHHF